MKEKGAISRKQFLTGGATVVFGAILGKLSGDVYAEEKPQNENSTGNTSAAEKNWEKLPLEILKGAFLVSDPASASFGGTVERENCSLSQYIHVYPGLELMLSYPGGIGEENGWVGYDKELRPMAILRSKTESKGSEKRAVVTIPAGVYYIRGSCSEEAGQPCAWVRNLALYAMNCGLNKPDVSSYMDITALSFDQRSRIDENGRFDNHSQNYPSLGDVFFTPIGTDIILTFNNANIVPYIHSGENYTSTSRKNIFDRHYGFGYSWYHCKTTEVCNWLGACYETVNGCARTLALDELKAAEPHLYIKFPSRLTNTLPAATIRTRGVERSYQRLFTVVHLTDTHGDADSTHAAYEYADQIGADFVALTGDYVPYYAPHGYDCLHSFIRKAKTPTVLSIGNHDVYYHTDLEVYEKSIAPIKDTLQASSEHPYYYRDFNYNGEFIRAISLYPFKDAEKTRGSGYYTQEQLQWLCEAMATVPDGGHIFILRHFSHHNPIIMDSGQAMFNDYGDNSTGFGGLWLDMGEDPVTAVVDAYNRRVKIVAHYTGYLRDGTEIVPVEYDFTNRPDSEFVAYFVGHVHCDAVGYARNTQTRQVVLCSLCTTGVRGSKEYDSYTVTASHRDYGTDSQIALNVFTFDFKKKSVYVARVGNGSFKDREKTWMELPYQL